MGTPGQGGSPGLLGSPRGAAWAAGAPGAPAAGTCRGCGHCDQCGCKAHPSGPTRTTAQGPIHVLPHPPPLPSPHKPDLRVQGQQEVAEFLEQKEGVEAAYCHQEAPDGLWAVAVPSMPAKLVQPQNLGGGEGGTGWLPQGIPPTDGKEGLGSGKGLRRVGPEGEPGRGVPGGGEGPGRRGRP